jgi:hypothetical protein
VVVVLEPTKASIKIKLAPSLGLAISHINIVARANDTAGNALEAETMVFPLTYGYDSDAKASGGQNSPKDTKAFAMKKEIDKKARVVYP